MSFSPVSVEVHLPVPTNAPERLRGSAAWLTPHQMTVTGHWYPADYRGKRSPERTWFYVTIAGYVPGTSRYARGQYGAELEPGPDGAYRVPEAPWLTVHSYVMDSIHTALRHLAAAVR